VDIIAISGGAMLDLLEKPELLSALLANMQDGLSINDTRGVQIYVNDALCRMLGFSRAELIGARPPYPYWPAEGRAAIEASFQRAMRGDMTSLELLLRRKDGSRVEVIVAPAELRDDSGAVIALFATIKDISERKQLERSLLASEQRWRSIAENPYDFVVLIDRDYRYTYVNHTAPGISADTLIGQATPFDFAGAEYHDGMRAAFETTFETGRATSYEVYVPQLDAWYSSIVGAVLERGRVSAVSILTREITQQKRAEETFRRSEQRLRDSHRMETIGTLAGGMAHDINNMLTPILGYADLAQRALPRDHGVQHHLQSIVTASHRARELVSRILLFSRRQESHKTTFDLRDSVREDVTLLRASLPANVELVTELPSEPVPVCADRAQIGQLLTNLATNALQATEAAGGRVTIAVSATAPALRGGASHGGRGERFASLCVADSGPGMDEETARRALEPFFTTRPVGSGTGLGLSIVDGVAREHGGEVVIASAPKEGTVVTVRLPMAPEVAAARAPDVQPSRAARAPLRVLVVDDEPGVVAVAQQALVTAGHEVTAVHGAREALDLFTSQPDSFDVVLTDQSMPQMTGLALIAALRAIRPRLACVLMTGLGDEATQRRARSLGALEVLAKPFAIDALRAAVERAHAE
jgi:PAS domain S-box-containing protein